MTMPENHLDLVVTPGSIQPERRASLKTTLIAVISMPLFFLLAFTICFVSATHAPVPHHMPITISGPVDMTEQIGDSISKQADGAFQITHTTDPNTARDAVQQRDAVGALIIDGTDITAITASGGGRLASATIESLGQQVAESLGGTAVIEDVAPLPADDQGGTVLFFFLVLCTVGAFLSITAIAQVFPNARTRSLVATAAGAALLVPVIGFSTISLFVDFGVTFGETAAVIGIGMLYAFTVGMFATFFTKLAGQGGVLLVILFLIAINFPSSGGSIPGSMLPPFWQSIHGIWVGSGAFEAMRSVLFFHGNDTNRWLLQLLTWTAASIILTLIVTLIKKQRLKTKARTSGAASETATNSVLPAPQHDDGVTPPVVTTGTRTT